MNATKIASIVLILGVFASSASASGVYFTINGPGEIKFEDSSGVYLESSRRNIFYRDSGTGLVSVFWDGAAFLGEKKNSPQVNALHVSGGGDFYFSISHSMTYSSTPYTQADLIHYDSSAGTYTTKWQVAPPPPASTGGQGWDLDALYLPKNDLSKILFSVGNNNNTFQNDDIIQWTLADGYSVFLPDLRGTIGGPGELDALLSPWLVVGGGNWPGAGGMFDNTNLYYYDGTKWILAIDLVSSFKAGPSGIISVHGEFEPPEPEPPVVPEPLTIMSLLMCVSGIAIYVLRQHEDDPGLL